MVEQKDEAHRVGDHLDKLFEGQLPVSILIRLHDRLVHYLLQLPVLEVVADHHFEDKEELAVGDVIVTIHVIHLERNCVGRYRARVKCGNVGMVSARGE